MIMMNPLASSEVLNIAIVKGVTSQNGKSIYSWFHYRPNSTTVYLHSPKAKISNLAERHKGQKGSRGCPLIPGPAPGSSFIIEKGVALGQFPTLRTPRTIFCRGLLKTRR